MAGTDKKDLTPQQHKAIIALLAAPSIAAAAQQAGIGERTLFRWLQQDDAFLDAYRAARREAVRQAMAQVQRYAGEAVETLYTIMTGTGRPSARIQAAKAILEYAVRGVEIEDLAARIEALEALHANQP
jgi:transposase-like protein